MIRCAVADLTPGMVLGKSIFDHHGHLLLAAGHRLEKDMISKIQNRGFYSVLIFKEGYEEIIPEDLISEELRTTTTIKVKENIEKLSERFKKFMPDSESNIGHVLRENKEFENVINVNDLKNQLRYILDEILSLEASKKFTSTLGSVSAYQYEHSMEVMLLSVMLGIAYEYTFPELLQLGTAALLHDLGKIVMPQIADRNEDDLRIDEKILFKEHPIFGSILLEKSAAGHFMERAAILQHHERQDGNGYPLHKIGGNQPPTQAKQTDPNRIFRFAEIISVANVYDNFVSPRPGHAPMMPENALKEVDALSNSALNSHIVQKLSNIVNLYPQGSLVKIENCSEPEFIGYVGAVKDNNDKQKKVELILFTNAKNEEVPPSLKVFQNDPKLNLQMRL